MTESKQLVVLGGAGDMGRFAARTAIDFDFISEVIIADLDLTAAEKCAALLGKKARALQLDVTDAARLASVLEPADFVINCVGPFFRFAVPILRAAIAAKTDYSDICDDPGPTKEMLALSGEAKAAGVCALIGMGASPGLTNLLAAKAIGELDETEEAYTGWDLEGATAKEDPNDIKGAGGDDPGPTAAYIHAAHIMCGKHQARRNGKDVMEKPLRKIKLDFPGIGRGRGWTIGHPEPLTLAHTHPHLKESANIVLTSFRNMVMIKAMSAMADAGVITIEQMAKGLIGDTSEIPKAKETELSGADAEEQNENLAPGRLPQIFALAIGQRGGRPARVGTYITSSPPGEMGGSTGVPCAIGLKIIANPAARKPGVYPPEGLLNPDAFFDALAPLCRPVREGHADLVNVASS